MRKLLVIMLVVLLPCTLWAADRDEFRHASFVCSENEVAVYIKQTATGDLLEFRDSSGNIVAEFTLGTTFGHTFSSLEAIAGIYLGDDPYTIGTDVPSLIEMAEHATQPTTPSTDRFRIYGYDSGSGTRLFFLDQTGTAYDLLLGGLSGAPIDGPYITQTPDTRLTAEQALSLLSNGLLYNTGGTLSQAVVGQHYAAANIYTVTDWGAAGDGVTDDTFDIQYVINTVSTLGGGPVYFPKGTYLISNTLLLPSKVALVGQGHGASIIKLDDSSDCNMLETENFDDLTGQNKWLTTDNVDYAFGITNLQFDGNGGNQSGGDYAIAIYGKQYIVYDVIIVDAYGVGFYSEAGAIIGQTDWTDMPTCFIGPLWVKDAGSHGFHYRGPHDGYIHYVDAGNSIGGDAFRFEYSSGTYDGNCLINFVHGYGATGYGFYTNTDLRAQTVKVGPNTKENIYITSSGANGTSIFNSYVEGADSGDSDTYWNVYSDAQYVRLENCTVRDTNTSAGGVKITGAKSGGKFDVYASSHDGIGVYADANQLDLVGRIEGYSGSGGYGIQTNTSARSYSKFDFTISNCDTAINNITQSSRNRYEYVVYKSVPQTLFAGNGPDTSTEDIWSVLAYQSGGEWDDEWGRGLTVFNLHAIERIYGHESLYLDTGGDFYIGSTKWNINDDINGAQIADDTIGDGALNWGSGVSQIDLDDVPDGASYEKVAASELSSGIYKDATDSVKGISSFSSSDFSVSSGAVSILAALTRDEEWNTEAEVEAIWSANIIIEDEIDSVSEIEAITGEDIITDDEMDSVSEIEAITGEDILTSDEADSESELEGLLDDVNDVRTNNDKEVLFSATIVNPLGLLDASTQVIFRNTFGATMKITDLYCLAPIDDVDFTLKETGGTLTAPDFSSLTTIEAITIDDNGTGVYFKNIAEGDIDHGVIEHGHAIVYDNDGSDEPDWVTINGYGWKNY